MPTTTRQIDVCQCKFSRAEYNCFLQQCVVQLEDEDFPTGAL